MKILSLVVLILTSCSYFKHGNISKSLIVEKINDNSYIVKDISFYDTNVLVTKTSNDIVIILSSPIDTVKSNQLLLWVRRKLQPRKIIAINTHFHPDGTGGNEAFNRNGVETWSSYKTRELFKKRSNSVRVGLASMIKDKKNKHNVLNTKNELATNFFKIKTNFKLHSLEDELEIFYPGPAHTKDNLVVYLPKQKILFAGCIVRSLDWTSLGNTKDGDLSQYYASVQNLLKIDADIVVPGHGKRGNRDLIKHTLKLAGEFLE